MNRKNRVHAIGIGLGLAVFVAVGLIALTGAGPRGTGMKPAPLDPSVAAPAEQLGKAFAMVAAKSWAERTGGTRYWTVEEMERLLVDSRYRIVSVASRSPIIVVAERPPA